MKVVKKEIGNYRTWAAEWVVPADGASLSPYVFWGQWTCWCSLHGLATGAMGRQRAVLKDLGATYVVHPKGATSIPQRWRTVVAGLDVKPWPDSGYWPPGRVKLGEQLGEEADPTDVLVELFDAGLVRDTRALDQAWIRLSGSSDTRLCRACGTVTRSADGFHRRCAG